MRLALIALLAGCSNAHFAGDSSPVVSEAPVLVQQTFGCDELVDGDLPGVWDTPPTSLSVWNCATYDTDEVCDAADLGDIRWLNGTLTFGGACTHELRVSWIE